MSSQLPPVDPGLQLRKIHTDFLPVSDTPVTLALPASAEIVHLAAIGNTGVKLWFSFDAADTTTIDRTFLTVGTGRLYGARLRYVGTAVGQVFVWHVFEPALPAHPFRLPGDPT